MEFNKETFITVMIKNWDKYNVRSKDLKRPWWFSCSNNLLEDPDFEHFSNSEMMVWLFLLSLGSKHVSPVFTVGWKLATRMRRRFRTKDFKAAIQKLHTLGIIEVEYQKAAAIRPPSGGDPASTLHNSTRHNNTGDDDHVRTFENSFNQEALDRIQWTLDQVFENNVPPDLKKAKARLLTAYGTPENFKACIEDIINTDAANPETNKAKWRSYVAVSIKRQAGILINAAS